MTITDAGKMFGLSADTLRYYEKVGLIPRVHRSESGIRDYQDEDLRWVEFAKCMRGAGLPVEVLIEYMALYQKGPETEAARKELLIEQRSLLKARIEEMQNTLKRLDGKIARYDENEEGNAHKEEGNDDI